MKRGRWSRNPFNVRRNFAVKISTFPRGWKWEATFNLPFVSPIADPVCVCTRQGTPRGPLCHFGDGHFHFRSGDDNPPRRTRRRQEGAANRPDSPAALSPTTDDSPNRCQRERMGINYASWLVNYWKEDVLAFLTLYPKIPVKFIEHEITNAYRCMRGKFWCRYM